jgi:hypothetical protein
VGSSQQTEPKFSRHVKDAYPTLEAIFEAGEAVQALVAHPGWAHIADMLEREIRTIDSELDGMTDPLPYEKLCLRHGRRGGVRSAIDAAQTILAVAERKHDEQRAKHERGADAP